MKRGFSPHFGQFEIQNSFLVIENFQSVVDDDFIVSHGFLTAQQVLHAILIQLEGLHQFVINICEFKCKIENLRLDDHN